MAVPAPIPGFSVLLGGYGKLFGAPWATVADWKEAPTLTVVIPALNEESTIPYAIASLSEQTLHPDKLVVVDDGSTDATADIVDRFADETPFPIRVISHDEPMGKTPSIKQVARESDSDLLFVLDADTYLESDDYLERVREPHANEDVACSFGRVRPITPNAKKWFCQNTVLKHFPEDREMRTSLRDEFNGQLGATLKYWFTRWPVQKYRAVLYNIEQGFTKDAYMRMFDTTLFPAGCGVMYDRTALVGVFDRYESSLGDNLTNSEDIFLGYAFVDEGLSNIQVTDVHMRTTEPSVTKFVSQMYLWSSAYLQSAYYFRKSLLQLRKRTSNKADDRDRPPVGRAILAQLIDGLYPIGLAILAILVVLQLVSVEWIVLLVVFEYALYTAVATTFSEQRLKSLWSSLLAGPVRFLALPMAAYTYVRVGSDIARGNRNWRK
jgi:glycosyltransferase involved in cell wall biosynthesis